MKHLLFIILFSIISLHHLKAQNFEKDLLMVNEEQNKVTKLCFNLTYTLHENHNYNSKIIHKSSGKYFKMNDKCLTVFDHIISLTTPNMVIMINKEEKKIVLKKEKQKKVEQVDVLKQLKDYQGYIEKVTPLQNEKNSYTYVIELKQKAPFPISKYEMTINSKNRSISKLTLFYKGKLKKDDDYQIAGTEVPRLDIDFTDYNKFELFNESEINSNFYFNQINNKFLPTNNFKGYDIKQL